MRKLLPALVLILLAPLIAEVLPGSSPLTRPSLLLFIVLIYGPGALLIRELVRRSGRGWPSILLLGAAYGMIEEGLALQSLFNPNLYHASDWGGRLFGINGVYAEAAIVIHAVWSAVIPILAADLLFPDRRTEPYLGRFGLIVTGVWYLVGVVLLGLLTRFSIAPGYWAPPVLLAFSAFCALVLAAAALFILPKMALPSRPDRDAPQPWIVLVVIAVSGVIWHFLLAILWRVQPVFAQWPLELVPMLSAMVIAGVVACLVRHWSAAQNWSDVHRLAVVSGAVISHSLIGAAIFAHTTFDRAGVFVLALALLSILAIRVRRQAPNVVAPTH
jgi:hypothetical protein